MHRALKQMESLDYSGGEIMRKLLFAMVGIVGVVFGVLAGILFAPRKGSETREEIARRSKPLQVAAKRTASRVGQKIQPAARLAGDRLPLGARAKGAPEGGERAAGVGEDDQIGGHQSNGTTNGRHAELEKVGSIS